MLKNLILIINLFVKIKTYLIIPFNTYNSYDKIYKNKIININDTNDIINLYDILSNNILYSNIEIGEPGQKVKLLIKSEESLLKIINNDCNLDNSIYDYKKSKSFKEITKRDFDDKEIKNSCIANETFNFFMNQNSFKIKDINILHSLNLYDGSYKEKYFFTCPVIGLKLSGNSIIDNLIIQLKKRDILETYDWFIEYDDNNNENGYLILGIEPHEFDSDYYYFIQLRNAAALTDKDYKLNWEIKFDKVYLYKDNINKTENKINLKSSFHCTLNFDFGIIQGNSEYRKYIKEIFFNDLITNNICNEIEYKKNKYIIYCDKNKGDVNLNKFPSLYFVHNTFYNTFELNKDDLFLLKDNILYFQIIFDTNSYGTDGNWKFGKIFLKKYFFSFNIDQKLIGFYNEELPGGSKNKKRRKYKNEIKNNYINNILIIFLFILFSIIGFILGKKLYKKAKKYKAKELLEENNYNSNYYEINKKIEMKTNIGL